MGSKKVKLTDEQKKIMARNSMIERNEKIRDLYETGKYSQRSLAKKMKLSKSRIGEIVY